MTEWVDYSLNDTKNREMLKFTVEHMYRYLATMYDIPSKYAKEVEILLLQSLARNQDGSEFIVDANVAKPWSEIGVYEFLGQFVKDNAILLARYGMSTTMPYAQLADFAPHFEETLSLEKEISGYYPMVDGKPAPAPNMDRIRMNVDAILSDTPVSRPQTARSFDKSDPSSFIVHGSLGKYKHSSGMMYWTLSVSGLGKDYLLAVPVTHGETLTSLKLSSTAGQRVIEDYLAHF
ncbi:MAG: hypothetical protein LBO09_07415 [Candidatus Peribacteria bacterium]|jgi:hypothetical protein|nr:hypothetical protein [Candidatus Peribacteria bacterium]